MTEPTAGDPFAIPPGGRPAPPPPQGFAAPEGYYPYGYPPQKKPKSWMNIVSLSAVGVGFVFPLIANVAGIVFGHLGVRAAKRGEADYRGVGLAGLIINYIAAILWVLGIIAYIAIVAWAISESSTYPNSDFYTD